MTEKQIVHHVEGPGGFTQSFSAETVDLLERMGLIKHYKTTSHVEYEYRFYSSPFAKQEVG